MNRPPSSDPLIFDIKRYAINDGPGLRIVIFFKGCNLDCAWCHNPESKTPRVQRMYARAKCIRCGVCVETCPEKAIAATPEGIVTDRMLCRLCGRCAEVCTTKALELSGKTMTATEILNEIEKERVFCDQSGGGVTFSGGEPLLYPRFLIPLLDECGRRGIHRAIDTAGNVPTEVLLEVAERTDLFLYDLKLRDSDRHRRWTGAPNDLMLGNLRALAERGGHINIRIPLIGGVNDDDDNLTACAAFVASLAGDKKAVNLLPYHKIAQTKYEKLGCPDDFRLFGEPTEETKTRALSIFREHGLNAIIGG